MSDKLSHYDASGQVSMVDVSHKDVSLRTAKARAFVAMSPRVLEALPTNAKGDPLEIARIAGIMAAKKTSDLIPLCHPLPLSRIHVTCEVRHGGIEIIASASTAA